MAKKNNKYRFVISPLFLGIIMSALLISSLILSGDKSTPPSDYWIPMLTGFIDIDFFSTTVSVLLSVAAAGYTAATLYIFNERHFNTGKSSLTLVMLYLILLMSDPGTIFFSGSSVAAPIFLWALLSTINSGNNNTEIFKAGFLISLATLFDYHLFILVPFILYYSLINRSFAVRSLVTSLISVVLPYLIVISVRYILFQDASLFTQILWEDIKGISAPRFNPDSFANIILLISTLLIAYKAVFAILNKFSSYKTIKYLVLLRLMIISLVLALIIVFYGDIQGRFMTLLAIPGAYIINEYLFLESTGKNKRAEFLVLLILLAISRFSEFM